MTLLLAKTSQIVALGECFFKVFLAFSTPKIETPWISGESDDAFGGVLIYVCEKRAFEKGLWNFIVFWNLVDGKNNCVDKGDRGLDFV